MAPTKEPSIEAIKRTVELIQESNPQWNVLKDIGYYHSVVSKTWCKYKRNGVVKKRKYTGKP